MKGTILRVLTGGPGGGKSTLIEELLRDPALFGRIATLPETMSLMRGSGISPREQGLQQVIVHLQMVLEDGLQSALGEAYSRSTSATAAAATHWSTGSISAGRGKRSFAFTGTCLEDHYRRHTAVMRLVTASDRPSSHCVRWPEAHRPEEIEDAVRLDCLLHEVWRAHPQYTAWVTKGVTGRPSQRQLARSWPIC